MGYPFIQARHFTPTGGRQIDWVVIHTMEAPETVGRARQVAEWFAGADAPRASAHYCVDDRETIQCVHDRDVAWHAPGANRTGIGIEHAGYARQTTADWDDAYSRAVLTRSALLTAELCAAYKIPVEFVTAVGLRQGDRGITTHAEVTLAFGGGDHWDPGPGFPMQAYISRVRTGKPDPIDWDAIVRWVEAIRLQEDRDMAEPGIYVDSVFHPSGDGRGYHLDRWGGVHAFGGARKIGGNPGYWAGLDVARTLHVTSWDTPAGYVVDLRGGVHPFGGARKPADAPYWEHEPLRRFPLGQTA